MAVEGRTTTGCQSREFLDQGAHCALHPAARSSCRIRCGVIGISKIPTPNGASASETALSTAAGAPIVPPSPTPLAPVTLASALSPQVASLAAALAYKSPGSCQTADAAPPPRNRWFVDSPLEGTVFELLVRGRGEVRRRQVTGQLMHHMPLGKHRRSRNTVFEIVK